MKQLQFATIMMTALALVPGGAHVLEMASKLSLDQTAYFTVQAIYRGWSLLGIVIIGAILANLILVFASWRQSGPRFCALAAFVLMALNLALFFVLVYPANQATENWTVAPADWEALRTRWEVGHAIDAGLTLLALGFAAASALGWRRAPLQAAS